MGKPWAELSSPERLDAILLAVAAIQDEDRDAFASAVALRVGKDHPMELAGYGSHGHGNVMRRMSTATRVTPGITALRKRGLLSHASRMDGLSGSADMLTAEGRQRVRELQGDA